MEQLNLLLTVLIAALIAALFFAKEDNGNSVTLTKNIRIIALVAIFVLAAVLRLVKIGSLPIGINQDGAMAAVDAKALADYATDRFGTHTPAHFKAWGYGQMSTLLSYIQASFIKLFGLNVYTMRIPVALVSMLGMLAVYKLIKLAFGENEALLAAALLIFNPWHFMQSRWALDCNMFPHFFAFGVVFLMLGAGKKVYLYLSMVFFGLCMYAYGVSFYMVPFFLIAVCVYLAVKKKVDFLDVLVCFILYFLISWPIYMTMFINYKGLPTFELPFVTMPYFEGSVRSSDILFFSENIKEVFKSNLQSTINAVFLQSDDLTWNTVKGFGTIFKCMSPLMILGGVRLFRDIKKGENEEKKLGAYLICAWWIFAVILGLIIRNVIVNRINIVFLPNFIFMAMGVDFVLKKSQKIGIAILAVYVLMSVLFVKTYFTDWNCNFWGDYVEALECAKDIDSDYYRFASCDPRSDSRTCTEILMMFVFQMDAEYFQGKTDFYDGRNIPYAERFRVGNLHEGEQINQKTVYVVSTGDLDLFDSEFYDREVFGTYSVIYSRGNTGE